MIFSDPIFYLYFLPLCVAGFYIFGRFGRRPAIGFLAFMSLAFYAKWSMTYVFLLIGSILFNFSVSLFIDRSAGRERRQKGWLIFGICSNLAALGYFKYLFPVLRFVGSTGLLHHQFRNIILPLGISFFTFTQIAYLVDLTQGVARCENLLSYTLFVTFFPHLIAGPILHHKEIMPQFSEERRYGLHAPDVALGISWFTMGMCKKVMIADKLAPAADSFFNDPQHAGLWTSWLMVLTYAMQLYFDFSGYADMAVGIARIFSIRFPLNFNSPYKADSIVDFWNRWHMTLTRYIMAYLYSPILFWISRRRQERGKKVSRRAQATLEGFASMIAMPTLFTMFITGVWHGAGLQYIFYGLIHGSYITVNHLWRTFVPAETRLRKLMTPHVAVGLTFVSVVMAYVMFRANGFDQALTVYGGMSGLHGLGTRPPMQNIVPIAALLAFVWLLPNTQEVLGQRQQDDAPNWSLVRIPDWQPNLAWWAAITATFALTMINSSGVSTFLYFQF